MPDKSRTDQLELWKSNAPSNEGCEIDFPEFKLESMPSDRGGLKSNETPAHSTKLLDPSFATRRPLNILVADDNEINRKVIRIILQKLGYNCVEAINGEEALKQYNSGRYDYIFMDLDMPEMNGIETAQAIRSIENAIENDSAIRTAEIIAVTANVSDETRLKCRRAGMNGYLEKPITAGMIKNQLLRSWPRVRSRRAK